MHLTIKVQQDDFKLQQEYDNLRAQAADAGAIAAFTGLVREFHEPGDKEAVHSLELEHYPGMTEKCLEEIALKAQKRWNLLAITIVHRVGVLAASDQIVLVLAASSHRQEAFDGAQFIMDYLKSEAPFWKRQQSGTGSQWIESRQSDLEAKQRWSAES